MGTSDGGGGQHGLPSSGLQSQWVLIDHSFQCLEIVRVAFVKDREHLIMTARVTFFSSLQCTVFSNPTFRGRTDWGRRVIVKKF